MKLEKTPSGNEWRVMCNGQEVKRGQKFECEMFMEAMIEKYGKLVA